MNTPAPKAVEALPELPEPVDYIEVCENVAYAYSAEQMRAYARTAVAAALAAAQAVQAKPDRRHVGDSYFEDWYSDYHATPEQGRKQTARDAYAAGMGDTSPQPPSPDLERQAMQKAPECANACQQAVDYGVWPEHSCKPKCVYLSTPPQEAGDADAERLDCTNVPDAPERFGPREAVAWEIGWEAGWDAARSPQQEPKA
jgi:hypothetical protein